MSLQSATPSPAKHSLLQQYAALKPVKARGRRNEKPQVQPILVDDPMSLDEPAVRRGPPPRAETVSGDVREWIAPARKPIEIFASKRDVIAGMYARGQIDKAMYLAARDYQTVFETAMSLSVRGIDPSAPVVSGGAGNEMLDAVAEATRRLARFERRLARQHGADGVAIMREVVGEGSTTERYAKRRGHGDKQAIGHWGFTLRRAMQTLAEATGYAVRGAYANRRRQEERRERQRRREEHEDVKASKKRKNKLREIG